MKKLFIIVAFIALFLCSCVRKSKYDDLEYEILDREEQIEELENRVEELENRVEELEDRNIELEDIIDRAKRQLLYWDNKYMVLQILNEA